MDRNILSVLEENSNTFSKGQKRIARYLLSNLSKGAFLTAGALGKETEVSESTVVRFATELGYDGFPQMQKALQDALMNRFHAGKDAPGYEVAHLIKSEAFSACVQAISSARRVYLIARGTEAVLAEYMGNFLEKQFADVHIVTPDSNKLRHAGAEDVALIFSFSPYHRETEELATRCYSAGVKVLGITNSERSSICRNCAYCLFIDAEQRPCGLSLVRPMALVEEMLNALISGKEGTCEF